MKLVALHNIDPTWGPDGYSAQSATSAQQGRQDQVNRILAEYQSHGMSYDEAWARAKRVHGELFAAMQKPAERL
jgi:hypothetical protein